MYTGNAPIRHSLLYTLLFDFVNSKLAVALGTNFNVVSMSSNALNLFEEFCILDGETALARTDNGRIHFAAKNRLTFGHVALPPFVSNS